MNTTYTIKNFRVFDEQGATFEMAPITILTGCNSSGKSSVTKSLMLLNDIFSRINREYKAGMPCFLENYALRLNSGQHQLGSFASIVNDKSSTEEFTIEYSGYTCFSNDRITVQITFARDDSKEDGNGRMVRIFILDESKNKICDMDFNTGVMTCNFALLKEKFFSFAHYASLYNQYRPLRDKYDRNERFTAKEAKEILSLQDQIGEEYLGIFQNIIPTIYKRDHLNELTNHCNFDNLAKYKSLFYIDALEWLDGYKKVDVRRVVNNHIKRSSLIERLRYQEQKEKVIDKIKLIVDEFYRSDFYTFNEFFAYYENLFLQHVKTEFMQSESDSEYTNSFIAKIEESLAYKYAGINSYVSFVKDGVVTYGNDIEEFWNKEELRFVFIVHYMRMITSFEEYQKIYNDDNYNLWYNTPIFDAMILYLCNIIEDVLVDCPSYITDIDFIDAQRVHAERYYNFHETSNFSSTLKEYLSQYKEQPKRTLFEVFNPVILQAQTITVKEVDTDGKPIFENPVELGIKECSLAHAERDYSKKFQKGSFVKKWIKEFDIADDIRFPLLAEGAIVSVVLVKDGQDRNLADFGFGVAQLLELMLRIENNIVKFENEFGGERIEDNQLPSCKVEDLIKKEIAAKSELGERVAPYLDTPMDLPRILMFELFEKQGEKLTSYITPRYRVNYIYYESFLALEEPETHLHPKYQAKLAEMFYDAYQKYNIHFIIETHSEYLVRRTQVMVAEARYNDEQELEEKCPFKVYYLPRPEDGKPYDLGYQINGKFRNKFGKGFLDVADGLALNLL